MIVLRILSRVCALHPFIHHWTFSLFTYLSYCEQPCSEHGSLYISSKFSFSFFFLVIYPVVCTYKNFFVLKNKGILPYEATLMNLEDYARSKNLVTEEKL